MGGRGFLRESALYAGSTAAEQGSRLVTGLVAAAMLGPEVWGYWFLLNLVLSYGSLLHLGTMNAMNREVPAAHGRGDAVRADAVESATLGTMLVSLAVAGLAFAVASAIPLTRDALRTTDLALMLGLLVGHMLYAFSITRGRSNMEFGLVSRQQGIFAVLHPVLAIAGAALFGLTGFILGQAVAYLFVIAALAVAGVRLPRPSLSWATSRSLVRIGLPIMLVGVVHTFFTTADRWIVAGLLGNEALGHYSLAIMTVSAVRLLPQVFSQQLYPRMSFAWNANGDRSELQRLGRRQAVLTFATAGVTVIPLALLAPWAIGVWLPQFTPGIGPLIVVLSVPLVTGVSLGYGNVLNVIDRQNVYLALIGVATAVNVAVSLVLVAPLGLVGVALGTVTGFLTLSVGLLVVGRKALAAASTREATDEGSASGGQEDGYGIGGKLAGKA